MFHLRFSRRCGGVFAGLVAALVVSVTGCGSSSRTIADPTASDDQAIIAFVHCIRHQGISMPDPMHRPGHTGLSLELPTGASASAAFRTAQQSCQHLLANTPMGQKMAFANSPALLDFNLQLAHCLRAHGIDAPDPTPEHPDPEGIGRAARATPAFQSADRSCRQQIPMPTIPAPTTTR
jgi:hypothetical protein